MAIVTMKAASNYEEFDEKDIVNFIEVAVQIFDGNKLIKGKTKIWCDQSAGQDYAKLIGAVRKNYNWLESGDGGTMLFDEDSETMIKLEPFGKCKTGKEPWGEIDDSVGDINTLVFTKAPSYFIEQIVDTVL